MALTPGQRLGSYEIVSPIGAGGMGQVFRARDTKLGRDVAIKVLPEEFSNNKERVARFEREARLLASLNHPNIATIHGLERSGEVDFLVMELVDGENLAERIARERLSIDDVLVLSKQMADALDAAHQKGLSIATGSLPTSSSPPRGKSKFWTSASRKPRKGSRRLAICRNRPP